MLDNSRGRNRYVIDLCGCQTRSSAELAVGTAARSAAGSSAPKFPPSATRDNTSALLHDFVLSRCRPSLLPSLFHIISPCCSNPRTGLQHKQQPTPSHSPATSS